MVTSNDIDLGECLEEFLCKGNLLILDYIELRELMIKCSYYYVSGMIAILYSGTSKEIYEKLVLVSEYLSNRPGIRIIHILVENTYFDWLNKSFSDLINGPVIPVNTVCS